jgi:hypothetical protein
MPDETYMDALRDTLKSFRTAATAFAYVEKRMEEGRHCQDTEELQYWEDIWKKHAGDRLGIALALLRAMNLFEQAGARIPNPRWKTPPWVYREWQSILVKGLTEPPLI